MNIYNAEFEKTFAAAAVGLYKEDAELAANTDTSDTVISKSALRRIRRKIKRNGKETLWSSLPLTLRRSVAAVLVICTVAFAFCMSISAVRSRILTEIVTEWNNLFVDVHFKPSETPPTTIEVYREPTLQPSGTERVVVRKSNFIYFLEYQINSKRAMTYVQNTISQNATNGINNEKCTIENIEVKGNKGLLFTYDDGSYIIAWSDGEYEYCLIAEPGVSDRDDIIRVAESVK